MVRKLRKALVQGGLSEGLTAEKHAAIEAIENDAADLRDLEILAPLAKRAGIDWGDLFPEWEGYRVPDPHETVTQKRRRLKAEARDRQARIVPELREAIRELKRARKQRAAHCRRQAKRRQAKVASLAKRAERELAKRVAKLKERAREASRACNMRDLDRLDDLLSELARERATIKRLREQARGLKSTRGQKGGRRAAELRAEALDTVARDVADDPLLAALWDKHKHKIKPKARQTRTEAFLEWVHDHPEAISELQAAQERDYAAEATEMLGSAKGAHRDLETCSAKLNECERWLTEVAPEGLSPTEVPF